MGNESEAVKHASRRFAGRARGIVSDGHETDDICAIVPVTSDNGWHDNVIERFPV